MPENDEPEDIDPADLDDLGDLGGGDDEPDEDDEPDKPYEAPDAETWAKVQRKLARQEDRITRLLGKRPNGKPAADVDRKLAAQLGKGKPADEDDEDRDTGEADRWKGIAIQNAAAAQIAAAGFTGSAAAATKLARLIDTSDVELDRSGRFDLEDQIDELREEYPELFGGGTRTGRPAPVVRRADNRRSAPKDPTRATSDAMLKAAGLTRRPG